MVFVCLEQICEQCITNADRKGIGAQIKTTMAKEVVNDAAVAVEEPVVESVEVTGRPEEVETFADKVKALLKSGRAVRLNDLTVRNVITKEEDNYTRHTFVLREALKAKTITTDENGNVVAEDGKSNNVFTSNFAIAGLCKEHEGLAWLANDIKDEKVDLGVIFCGAKVDVIQERIPAGVPWHNPFTTRDDFEESTEEYERIINHIVAIKLSNNSKQMMQMLALSRLGAKLF